ncbi:Pycsar system effector family protein [Streptosporangium sp. NPDC051022]|uniref:Pycsar system effector family protein n=1 Tax=Streptosporangium sp. NPDC051022 TaxID=3155752 RepID=UPI003428529D
MDTTSEIANVRAELGRADGKAATLAGLVGTAVSVAVGLAAVGAGRLAAPVQAATWITIVLLAAALVMLLLAIRPALARPGAGVGWAAHADSSPTVLATTKAVDHARAQYAELVHLSQLTSTKYRLIRRAVDLLLVALAVAMVAAVLASLLKGTL